MTRTITISKRGEDLLNDPLLNKGTAFTYEERDTFGLHGLLPFYATNIEQQIRRRYENFQKQQNPISKYIFLSALQNRNEVLFYRLVTEHITEMLPLIYTPTVGDASLAYSSIYTQHRGLFLSYPLKDKMEEMIANFDRKEVDVIVVTDGERILGLGDLGANGMAISVGKTTLYSVFGGIYPGRTLPIFLDVGTNNQALLNDPIYVGWKHPRITGKEYDDFIEAFITAIKKRYPNVLLQWEDFARQNAWPLLERYRDKICTFNDDIQGTAAVVLSAILSAVKIKGEKLSEQKIVLFGAGSAGLGIARQLLQGMREEGLSDEEALKKFYLVDRFGFIHENLEETDHDQKQFAQKKEVMANWKIKDPSKITLHEVVQNVHPTVLIGVSAQAGAFTEEIVKSMAETAKRPIICPLSNPTDKSEAHPKDLLEWTKGQAIIATGSPFPPIEYNGKTYRISQCNNVYIFPGLGLGVIASGATKVTDHMFLRAADALKEFSPALKDPQGPLFPKLEDLRGICKEIALAVAFAAQEEGVAPKHSREELIALIDSIHWNPEYPIYRYSK